MKALIVYGSISIGSVVVGWLLGGMSKSSDDTVAVSAPAAQPPLISTDAKGLAIPAAITAVLEKTGKLTFAAMSKFHVRLAIASAGDCRKWLALLVDDPSANAKKLKQAILLRWAELAPKDAIAALRNDDRLTGEDSDLKERIFRDWATRDLDAAVDTALAGASAYDIYGVMWGADPNRIEYLYDLLLQRGFDRTAPGVFDAIYPRIAEIDIERAAQLTLERLNVEIIGFENVLNAWVRKDAVAAFTWAESIENSRDKQRALDRLAVEWLEEGPVEALEAMWGKVDFSKLENHALAAPGSGKQLTDAEFNKMLGWLDGRADEDPVQAAHVLQAMALGLSYGGPPARIGEIASRIDEGVELERMDGALVRVVARWAAQDEDGLERFINTVDNEKIRSAALDSLIKHWSNTNPLRALELASELEQPMETGSLVHGLLRTANDPEEILNQLPASMHADGLKAYVYKFGSAAPEEVAAFLDGQPPGEGRSGAMLALARQWAPTNPQAAGEFYSSIDVEHLGDEQFHITSEIAKKWAMTDAAAAKAWASNLADPGGKVNALRGVASSAIVSDPHLAIEIATQIEDRSILSRGLASLAHQEPDAALAWFEANPESDARHSRTEIEAIVSNDIALNEALK